MPNEKIIRELEDSSTLCMDASARLDKIVLGLRSGLILAITIKYGAMNAVVDTETIELGFHQMPVTQIKLSGDGRFGISGGSDPYLGLWNLTNKVLLQKIALESH